MVRQDTHPCDKNAVSPCEDAHGIYCYKIYSLSAFPLPRISNQEEDQRHGDADGDGMQAEGTDAECHGDAVDNSAARHGCERAGARRR